MLFLRKYPTNIHTFSLFFDVSRALRTERHLFVCSRYRCDCFLFADTPKPCDGFCQPFMDKRPSIFSACYNCFFSLIPLK